MSDSLEQKTNELGTSIQEETATNENDNKDTLVNTEAETGIEASVPDSETKKKSKKPLIFAAIGVAAVAVIVAVIIIIVANAKSEEAKRVDSLISSIGTVTLDSEKKIAEAEKEVKALKKEDYEQLDNVKVLEEAREKYDYLVAKSEADDIIFIIDEIGEVTEGSKQLIESARSQYNSASAEVKKLVTNYDKLTQAESKLSDLQAARVESLIDKIGKVNEKSENKIKEAESAYNALSQEAKNKVKNHIKITEAKAAMVESLINGIGKVNEKSESKIKKAENAYDALPSEVKSMITNYSKLTDAKKELSSIKKQNLKEKRDKALSKLNKKYDDVDGITWYTASTQPQYANTRSYVLPYIGMRSDGDASLYLMADYTGDDWIFYKSLTINADGKRFEKNCSYDVDRDNKRGDVWEFYNHIANDDDIEWLKAVANSNNATIRFRGEHYYDLNVSDSDKQAIKEVIEAYELVFEYALYDAKELLNGI